jgi:hypothetical protein
MPAHPSSPFEYLVDEETGCWIWQRYVDEHGYGRAPKKGIMRPAHRVLYERFVAPVPAHLHLDHLCRNTLCVNPEHMEPVTPAENVRRGLCAKLTPADVREIRAAPASVMNTELAKRYGVDPSAISRARRGLQWRHLEDDPGRL